MEKTPWFDGSVKPVRVGYYERHYSSLVDPWLKDWWSGSKWLFDRGDKPMMNQSRPWRGLTKPPKGTP